MTLNVVGICAHGLLGDVYSLGMDSLAQSLNKSTPEGVHFTVEGGNYPVESVLTAELLAAAHAAKTAKLVAAASAGAIVIPIGHSLGADWVWDFANSADAAGIKLPLAISFDPVCWTSDSQTAGQWVVPANVAVAFNFRQTAFPGGGKIVAADKTKTIIHEVTLNLPHASFGQWPAVDTDAASHAAAVAAVMGAIRLAK